MRGLTTAQLGDAASELGLDITVRLQCNHPKLPLVSGRARTLSLRALLPDEKPGGIYSALETYKYMKRGDFIVVARGDDPERAYFGGINAALAKRAGAQGAAIDGFTRDTHAFPTWSRGRTAKDCRDHASVESYDQPIVFGGVTVGPGSLVVADGDGLAFIPKDHESEIIFTAQKIAEREQSVTSLIWSGWELDAIRREYGDF